MVGDLIALLARLFVGFLLSGVFPSASGVVLPLPPAHLAEGAPVTAARLRESHRPGRCRKGGAS